MTVRGLRPAWLHWRERRCWPSRPGIQVMRMRFTLCILGLCSASSGCEMGAIAARNLAYECTLRTDNSLACVRNRCLANKAWNKVKRTNPGHAYSKDYVRGFKDGFADYLYAGGCGCPSPLPAQHSCLAHYRRSRCHEAIDDWLAGFQFGVATAQARGYRKWAAVPSAAVGPLISHPPPVPGPEGIYPPPPPSNGSSPSPHINPVLPLPTPLPDVPEDPQSATQPSAEDGEKG